MKFHVPTLVFQVVNFVVLLLILHRLLYRPLREIMEKRRAGIREQLEAAERGRREAEELRGRVAAEAAGLEKLRAERLDALKSELELERNRLLDAARAEAVRLGEKEQALVLARRREQEEALAGRAVEIVDRYARRLLEDLADEELHRLLVRRFLAGVGGIAAAIAPEGQEAPAPALEAVFARPAQEMELVALREAFTTALRRPPASITATVDRGLLAGVKLTAGGRVFDASLAGQIAALTERLGEEPGAAPVPAPVPAPAPGPAGT